jgi:disulfide bond formation protein DsbB
MSMSADLASPPSLSPAGWRGWLLPLAWAQSIVATLGSLYFSEVMNFTPCDLCWYQRVCMYPLMAVFGVALWRRDPNVRAYALPLTAIGWLIAGYHTLEQYAILPTNPAICGVGLSCTTLWINWFGFITIPLLSFTAFTVIALCLALYRPQVEDDDGE